MTILSNINLLTNEKLLQAVSETKTIKPSANDIREQRVSFIFGCLRSSDKDVTRERINEVLDTQEGR